MGEDIINKLLQFVEKEGISKRKFYRQTGLTNGFLDGKKDIGVGKVALILQTYPQINPLWLLSEEGTMYRNKPSHAKQTINGNNNVANLSSHNQIAPNSELDQLRVTIQFLQSENKNLKDLVATQKELISMLKNKTNQQ